MRKESATVMNSKQSDWIFPWEHVVQYSKFSITHEKVQTSRQLKTERTVPRGFTKGFLSNFKRDQPKEFVHKVGMGQL